MYIKHVISFHFLLDFNTVIATNFCTWYDSCAVVACAKICCDLMAGNGITTRRIFHRIWREFCIILNVTYSELTADSTNVSNHQVVMATNQPLAILSTASVHVAAELYSPQRSSLSSPLTCLKTCLYNVVYATWYFIVFLCIFVNCKLVSSVCHKHSEHVALPRFRNWPYHYHNCHCYCYRYSVSLLS